MNKRRRYKAKRRRSDRVFMGRFLIMAHHITVEQLPRSDWPAHDTVRIGFLSSQTVTMMNPQGEVIGAVDRRLVIDDPRLEDR